jgi:hypothetical protein
MLLTLLHLNGADGEHGMNDLRDVLFNALDGNALYEFERASQKLAEDDAERAYYAGYNAGVAD